jgi:hypothetical protein
LRILRAKARCIACEFQFTLLCGTFSRHCEPTGRAKARPMTGSAKQSLARHNGWMDCFAALAMTVLTPAQKRKCPAQGRA